MSTYVTIFNLFLYSNVLFLPVLLTKGISVMAACLNNRCRIHVSVCSEKR